MKKVFRALKSRTKSLTYSRKERRHVMVGAARLWKMKRDFQFQFLKTMNLMPEHYLLDIGCGTLRGGIPLINYLQDGHYFGVEARAEVLDEGRKELQEEGLEGKCPTLFLSKDMSQLTISQKFDFIWGFSVLMHMTDVILNNTLEFVSKHLSDEGVFYANVYIGERKDRELRHKGSWQVFPKVWRTFEFYKKLCANNGLKVSDLGPLKDLGHVSKVESQDSQRMLKISKIGKT